jgi:hypothetical protein
MFSKQNKENKLSMCHYLARESNSSSWDNRTYRRLIAGVHNPLPRPFHLLRKNNRLFETVLDFKLFDTGLEKNTPRF